MPSATFAAVLGSSGSILKSSVMTLPFRCIRQQADQGVVPISSERNRLRERLPEASMPHRTSPTRRRNKASQWPPIRRAGYQDGVRDAAGDAFLAISPLPATAKSRDIGDSACQRVQWHKTERRRLYMFH
jgi:hypothetical protein